MKLFVSEDIRNNRVITSALYFYLFFISLYWLSALVHFWSKYKFSTEGIRRYFFGSSLLPEPLSIVKIAEDTHVSVFIISLLLLSLTQLIFYTRYSDKFKYLFTVLLFFTGAMDVTTDYIIYFAGPSFAVLKLISFCSFQILLAVALLISLKSLMKRGGTGNSSLFYHKITVLIFSLFTIGFFFINLALFSNKIGWSFSDISSYYLGNLEQFMKPKSFSGMLEITFLHFLAMGIFLVTVAHFILLGGHRFGKLLVILLFSTAFFNNISGFLIRFVAQEFVYLKFLSFWGLELCLLLSSFLLISYSYKFPIRVATFMLLIFLNSVRLNAEERVFYLMGTYAIFDLPHHTDYLKTYRYIRGLEEKFSDYIPGSDVTRINTNAGKEPIQVSSEVMDIVKLSNQISEKTSGYFDITIGALTINANRLGRITEAEALKLVDYRNILTLNNGVLLKEENMAIDLGGIGKGYSIQKAYEEIKTPWGFVAIAGDMKIWGHKRRLAIKDPVNGGYLLEIENRKDICLSTSGNYIKDHIRTDDKSILQVSVGHPDCAFTDALATALLAMPEDIRTDFLEKYDEIAVVLLFRNGELFINSRFYDFFEVVDNR